MCFVSFNLSRYNSSDQWLRLNHFKIICWRIGLHHAPPPRALSDDRESRIIVQSETPDFAMSLVHL